MDKLFEKKVKTFMTKDVIAVTEDETLKNVFKLMDKHGILGVPVVGKEDEVVGMITESDLIEHFTTFNVPKGISILGSIVYMNDMEKWNENLKEHCAEKVEDMMSTGVVTIMEDDDLQTAIDQMAEKGFSRLPVVNEKGELTGIITRTDLVHQLAKAK